KDRKNVHVLSGDANEVLVSKVFPRIRYEDYRRALCVLDPYGLHLSWEVVKAAAGSKTIEIFLNFPVMDMNMNVLLWRPDAASTDGVKRMNAFWGDDSWREAAYSQEQTLFGPREEKQPNEIVASAYKKRLIEVAGFKFVPEPAPMRN